MATTTLITTGGRYGWKADYTSGASAHFFAGAYSGTGHNYDSAIKFEPNKANFGNGKTIIVTGINLVTTAHDTNPGVMSFSINRTGSAAYDSNSRIDTIGNNAGGNYNFSLNRSHAEAYQINILNTLATYLQNGITFYFHVFSKNKGGRFYGPSDNRRPRLEISWTYPITDGTLTSTSYNTGDTAILTINPQDSSLQHDITWTISGYTIKIANNLSGNVQDYLAINPSFDQIGQWFSEFSRIANGQVIISTHTQGSAESLGTITKNFTVNLTESTCRTVDTKFGVTLHSLSPSSGGILDGNKYAINKTQINYHCDYYSEVDPFSEVKLQFSGGLIASLSLSGSYGTTPQTVASQERIVAMVVAKSKRGLTYTSNIIEIPAESIIYYTPPSIQNINFYRTDGTNELIEGTKLGGTFRVQVDAQLSNEASTVQVILSGIASTTIANYQNYQTYTNNNFFNNVSLDPNLNYNITINATDTFGTTSTANFTLSTAQYLIHFPQGGQGLGLGAVGQNDNIVLGWPLKNFRIRMNDNNILDFSGVSSQEGFQSIIGGPFWSKNSGQIVSSHLTANADNTNTGRQITMNGHGLICTKSNGVYGLIWDNGQELWIGSTWAGDNHHVGKTFISSGYTDDTKNAGNDTIYISVPNNTSNSADNYRVLHEGNYENIIGSDKVKAGELFYVYAPCYCYLTGNNKSLIITIPLRKSLVGITQISLNRLCGYARGGTGGYLIGGYGEGGGYNFLDYIGWGNVLAINDASHHDIDYETNTVTFRMENVGPSFNGTNNSVYIFQPLINDPIQIYIVG